MVKPKSKPNQNSQGKFVCYCNRVPKEPIEKAIRRGCHSLAKIFDATNAGVGACGGSCRPYIEKMIESFCEKGEFPELPRPGGGPKVKR